MTDDESIPASLFLMSDAPERSGAGAMIGEDQAKKRGAKFDAPPGEPCPHCGATVEAYDAYQVVGKKRWHQRCNDAAVSARIARAVTVGTYNEKVTHTCMACREDFEGGYWHVDNITHRYICPDCARKQGVSVPDHLLKGFKPFDPATLEQTT